MNIVIGPTLTDCVLEELHIVDHIVNSSNSDLVGISTLTSVQVLHYMRLMHQ